MSAASQEKYKVSSATFFEVDNTYSEIKISGPVLWLLNVSDSCLIITQTWHNATDIYKMTKIKDPFQGQVDSQPAGCVEPQRGHRLDTNSCINTPALSLTALSLNKLPNNIKTPF
jgi:hypothetical protein